MTRDQLWRAFTELIAKYSDLWEDSEVLAFVAGMDPDPDGRPHDPAFEQTYQRLFNTSDVVNVQDALEKLAEFVDEELVGSWKIEAGKRIAADLRSARDASVPQAEPIRSWLRSLADEPAG